MNKDGDYLRLTDFLKQNSSELAKHKSISGALIDWVQFRGLSLYAKIEGQAIIKGEIQEKHFYDAFSLDRQDTTPRVFSFFNRLCKNENLLIPDPFRNSVHYIELPFETHQKKISQVIIPDHSFNSKYLNNSILIDENGKKLVYYFEIEKNERIIQYKRLEHALEIGREDVYLRLSDALEIQQEPISREKNQTLESDYSKARKEIAAIKETVGKKRYSLQERRKVYEAIALLLKNPNLKLQSDKIPGTVKEFNDFLIELMSVMGFGSSNPCAIAPQTMVQHYNKGKGKYKFETLWSFSKGRKAEPYKQNWKELLDQFKNIKS
jgi:hypothetical protein